MGLFRLAIVAAVGVSLLPADAEQQEKLMVRAADAAHWTLTYCERNKETCTQAANVWEQFKKKAEFGARLAYDMAIERSSGASGETTGSVSRTLEKPQTSTLRKSDLEPAWRGAVTVKARAK